MAFKKIWVVILAMLTAACSASGPGYPTVAAHLPPLAPDSTRLVFYRPDSFSLSGRSPNVEINGAASCDLSNAGFFMREMKPMPTIISASLWDMPGTSRISFNPKAGQEYYIRIAPDQGKVMGMVAGAVIGGAIGGGMGNGWDAALGAGGGAVAGGLVAEAMSSHSGPFDIDMMDKQVAQGELGPLKMVTGCNAVPAHN